MNFRNVNKMSTVVGDVKMLTQSEVNKKIIENPPKVRPYENLLGPFGRYDDENYDMYNKKKKQFYEACKKYNRMNQDTLISCSRRRLHEDYMANLDCDFLVEDEEDRDKLQNEKHHSEGRHIRKRTERPIHHVPHQDQMVCSLEPWFKRHLVLNKFIWAARTIVIKNRLLKVLAELKELDEEKIKMFENKRSVTNVSYAELFQKFLE